MTRSWSIRSHLVALVLATFVPAVLIVVCLLAEAPRADLAIAALLVLTAVALSWSWRLGQRLSRGIRACTATAQALELGVPGGATNRDAGTVAPARGDQTGPPASENGGIEDGRPPDGPREVDEAATAIARMATSRRQIELELRTRAGQQAAVADLGRLALTGTPVKELMEHALDLVQRHLGVDICSVLKLSEDGEGLHILASRGFDAGTDVGRIPPRHGSQAGYTLLTDGPVVTTHLPSETRFVPPPLLVEHGVICGLTIAIRGRRRPFGTMGAHSTRARQFSADDIAFVEAIANVLGAAVWRLEVDEERQQLVAILDATPDFVGVARPTEELIYMNAAARRALGIGPDEDISRCTIAEFVTPGSLARVRTEAIPQATRHGVAHVETECLARDGQVIPVSQVIIAHRKEDGTVVRLASVARDIRERLQAERAVREAEELFRQMAEGIQAVVWLADATTGAIRYVNCAFERIWGQPVAALYADPEVFFAAIHPRDRAAVAPSARELPHDSVAHEYRIVRPDGETRWIRDRVYVIRDADGAAHRLAGIAEDITELHRIENELRRRERLAAVGAVAAGVAHEVRNPLFGMSALLDAFEARFGVGGDQGRIIEELRRETVRLSRLMEDLLDLGRPSALSLEPVPLEQVLRRAIKSCAATAAGRRVRVTLTAPPRLPPALADRERAIQVFQNLIENAVQHARLDGEVALAMHTVRDARAWIEVTVADDGSGIAADDLPHIFQPFFSRRRGGTGLGLSIAQRIITDHGGTISAGNRPAGGGLLTLRWPVAEPEAGRGLLRPASGG